MKKMKKNDEFDSQSYDIGSRIGIEWKDVAFTPNDLGIGIEIEKEHLTDIETKVIETVEEAAKIAWAHLKEDPKYYEKLSTIEEFPKDLEDKIQEGSLTLKDLNRLIRESYPESVRNRIRRKTLNPVRKRHTDNVTGHSKLGKIDINKRVMPKRSPDHQQDHGESKAAHKRSTRTQGNL